MIRALVLLLALSQLAQAQPVNRKTLGLGHIVDVSAVVAKRGAGKDCSAELTAAIAVGVSTGGEVVLPAGDYYCNITLNNVKKLTLRGSGRLATRLISRKANTPALTINGMWYSRLQDLGLATRTALADHGVLEVNGGTSIGIQGNTFDSLFLNGQGTEDGKYSKYCMTMAAATKGVPAQGSEQLFLNCHFLGASQACYYQSGFNALNNTFLGGNFQCYSKHAIELDAGSVNVVSVGFQSTAGYSQIVNNGWDISLTYGGANESILVFGCRTESLQFIKSSASQRPHVIGCQQIAGIQEWTSGIAYTVGQAVLLSVAETTTAPAANKLYVCAKANSDAVFTQGNWTLIDFNCVDIQKGLVQTSDWRVGKAVCQESLENQCAVVTTDYAVRTIDTSVLARAAEPIALALYPPTLVPEGHTVVIVRAKSSTSDVTVSAAGFYFDDDRETSTLSVSRSITLRVLGADDEKRWYVVGEVR